jgi:hypothetical protein
MRARSILLLVLSVAMATSSLVALAGGAGAAVDAKKKKLKCSQGDAAIAEIEPLFDINSNVQNSFDERVGVVQFGNLKEVQDQIKAVDANNPVADVRAEPQSNIVFVDKVSATGDLVITFGGGANTLEQGTQFFMCVGKDQNGTKKGAWRITLYSICNLYQLNPCSDKLVNKALNSLSPGLLELANQ